MRAILAAGLGFLAIAGAAQAQTKSYEINNQDAQGAPVTGQTSASVTDSQGNTSTITFAGRPSPSITIRGSTGATNGTFANAHAEFSYDARIEEVTPGALQALADYCRIAFDCLGGPIGTASGSYTLTGTGGSFGQVSLDVNGHGFNADCDSGRFGNGCGVHSYSQDVYLPQDFFCPGADRQNCGAVVGLPFSPILFQATLSAEGDVFGGLSEQVLSAIDPVFSLNDEFFTDRGFTASDFTLTFDPGIGNGAAGGGVPEPATWAMMLLGFVGLGAVLRRRRTAVAA